MPKVKAEKSTKALRHNPLADEILEERDSAGIRRVPRAKNRRPGKAEEDGEDAGVLPVSMTRKVLEMAQAQKNDEGGVRFAGGADADFELEDGSDAGGEDEEVEVDVEIDADGFCVMPGGATEEEERAMALFLPGGGGQPKAAPGPTLADVILQKIQAHEAKQAGGEAVPAGAALGEAEEGGLSTKVIGVYSEIGKWLKHYKSGKLPKALKVVPNLVNWEEVLSLTNPLGWSPAAMYEVVAIFASNLNPKMAQRFYNLVLLPAVRQNIAEYKKLNFHYYRALRKALFKPAAFFKGIMLPLATENCTMTEANILGSVLAKASIPPMHSAATLARLAVMTPWYGTTSILMAAMINKKYALPVRVVEGLVAHFCAFARNGELLPLVWHRCLLLFVQRYKFNLDEDQRRRLRELLRVHCHDAIGPEIRRELLAPKPGEVPSAAGGAGAMDTS